MFLKKNGKETLRKVIILIQVQCILIGKNSEECNEDKPKSKKQINGMNRIRSIKRDIGMSILLLFHDGTLTFGVPLLPLV